MNVRISPLFFGILFVAAVFAMPVLGGDVSDRAMQDEIKALKQMVLELQNGFNIWRRTT